MNIVTGVVWARLKYHVFWPAIIVDDPPNGRKTPKGKVWVFFFGSKNL